MVQLKPQKELTRDWPKTWSVPTLVVRCIVFNHGKFIERCLQGFLMQETNFPFEVFVHDDASTDESAEIIRRYAERYPLILKPVYENENQYSKKDGSFFRTTWQPVIQGGHKYIALCEGDDYWTDPKKLQKQVEYMDAHPGCAGCFHERVKGYEDGRPIPGTELPDEMKHVLSGDDIAAWTFPVPATSTVLYRRDAIMDRPERMNTWKSGDRAMALWAAYAHGTLDWVEGVQPSVYRIHGGGVYRGVDELHRLIWEHEISRMTLEQFPVSPAARRENYRAWVRGTYWAWRKWHASESEEVRRDVKKLVEQDEAAWPMMRWWLWLRQTGYWLDRGRALVWHGMVSGMKRVLPQKGYGKLRDVWRKRSDRALNGRKDAP